MKRLMIVMLIPFLFSSCAPVNQRKVSVVSPLPLVFLPPEFKNDSVDVTYLQRSTTTANVIAVVPVSGEISEGGFGNANMVENVKSMLRIAAEDYRVKAVILKVDSPGGSTNASNLIWHEVMKFKKTGKPVVAFFNGIAASGGYYVSAPADKIIATPETETGSIGVIRYVVDVSSKLAKEGVKYITIKSGHNKDMLSPHKPATKEALKIMQRIVDSSYERFVQKVAQGRHMNSPMVRILADGRIYDAEQALKNGLIDQIGYIEDSFEAAKNLANVNDASLIELKSKNSAASNFLQFLNSKSLIEQYFPIRQPGLYYLWIVN